MNNDRLKTIIVAIDKKTKTEKLTATQKMELQMYGVLQQFLCEIGGVEELDRITNELLAKYGESA